jgi:hypothetical protein
MALDKAEAHLQTKPMNERGRGDDLVRQGGSSFRYFTGEAVLD